MRNSWGFFRFHMIQGMQARGRQILGLPCSIDEGGAAGGGGGQGGGAGAGAGQGQGSGQGAGAGAGQGGNGGGNSGGGAGQGQGHGSGQGQGGGEGDGGAQPRRLTRENQGLRKQLRAMRTQLDTLLGEGDGGNEDDGGGSPAGSRQTPATDPETTRRIQALEARDIQREAEAVQIRTEAGIDQALAGLNLTDADEARASLLRKVVPAAKAKVGDLYLSTDGKVVTKVKVGEKEVESVLTGAILTEHKILKPIYLKAKGVGGSGSSSAAQSGAAAGAGGPVDRAQITDPDYYAANRKQILAQAGVPRT